MLLRRFLSVATPVAALLLLAPNRGTAQIDSAKTEVHPAYEDVVTDLVMEAQYDFRELQRRLRYPDKARAANIEGVVVLRALVDAEGTVVQVVVERSDSQLFEETAINALRATPFTPARTAQGPVATWKQVDVSFRLTN